MSLHEKMLDISDIYHACQGVLYRIRVEPRFSILWGNDPDYHHYLQRERAVLSEKKVQLLEEMGWVFTYKIYIVNNNKQRYTLLGFRGGVCRQRISAELKAAGVDEFELNADYTSLSLSLDIPTAVREDMPKIQFHNNDVADFMSKLGDDISRFKNDELRYVPIQMPRREGLRPSRLWHVDFSSTETRLAGL